MSELINTKELIEQGGELLKQPAVQNLFTQLTGWVGGLLNKNQKAKEKILEAQKNQGDIAALKENITFLQDWNTELQQELETRANEIETFAKQSGMDLSGAHIEKAMVNNTVGDVTGGINIGDDHSTGSQIPDIDKLIDAIKTIKKGIDIDVIANLSGLDKSLLQKIEQAMQ